MVSMEAREPFPSQEPSRDGYSSCPPGCFHLPEESLHAWANAPDRSFCIYRRNEHWRGSVSYFIPSHNVSGATSVTRHTRPYLHRAHAVAATAKLIPEASE